jgi:SPP1 gp7 family putative phage head morphogenesis protein
MARLSKEGQLLHDVTVRFQVYLERLKAGEVKQMDSAIRQMDTAIRRVLNEIGNSPARSRLEKQLVNMRKEMLDIADKNAETYMKTLRKFSDYSLDFHTRTIELVLPAGAPALASTANAAAWAGVLASPIQATGTLLEDFVDSWGARTVQRVESAIRTGFAQGKTVDEITRIIRGTKANNFTDGILGGVTKREASAMVRTALQHVNNAAQQLVYEDNGDIIEGYIWISTLDSRTSQTCRSLDGEMFKLGKGPVPPIHINCRSSTIPKVKGVDLLSETTRASVDGQVSAKQTYYEWLKTQPADFQDDALGPVRGKLFREGGLSAEQFSRLSLDKNFQPLTLEEMRQKNPSAFKRAGI